VNKKFIVSLNEINQVVNCIKDIVLDYKNIVIILQGDLASGKTTLVKYFVASLGIKQSVTSPTFSLQNIYDNKVFHYDIYNKTLDEFISLGLLEELEKNGYHFVEWGDEKLKNILDEYKIDNLILQINKLDGKREYICQI
jgi:tRNA threonylcarbamoyladenosine biosynthesis protein TsaE